MAEMAEAGRPMKGAATAPAFSDLDTDGDGQGNNAEIDAWLADNGVTLGCNPPANDQFCPGDNVRRETMAAFMRRLAENQVVDAKTAITAETATNATNATNAANAASAVSADDADQLDGLNSDELVRAYGATRTSTLTNVTTPTNLATLQAEAPVAGVFAITAVSDIEHDCTQSGSGIRGDTQLKVNGTSLVTTQEARDECVAPYDIAYAATAAATVAVEVPAGTHTIDFDWDPTTGAMWSSTASITVIFTPFGSGLSLAASPEATAINGATP